MHEANQEIIAKSSITPSSNTLNGITSPTGSASEGVRPQVLRPDDPYVTRFGPPPQPAGQGNYPWATTNPAPQIGNLGKNTMTGPGTNNFDLSVYRNLKFTEKVTGQLRIEGYNAFNHTQFSSVDTALRFDNTTMAMYNTLFNQPTGARPPRRIQIAMRIRF